MERSSHQRDHQPDARPHPLPGPGSCRAAGDGDADGVRGGTQRGGSDGGHRQLDHPLLRHHGPRGMAAPAQPFAQYGSGQLRFGPHLHHDLARGGHRLQDRRHAGIFQGALVDIRGRGKQGGGADSAGRAVFPRRYDLERPPGRGQIPGHAAALGLHRPAAVRSA